MNGLQVFIVHWNRPEECIQSVESLLNQSIDLSITVVDNASYANHLERLSRGLRGKAKIHALPENCGWGGAFNAVLKKWYLETSEEYCVLAAHDALPQERCLYYLLEALQKDPSLGIASAEYGDDRLPHFSQLRGPQYCDAQRGADGSVEPVDFPHGTLMMCRRSCLEQLGGFDERFFAYGDEFDLGIRARDKGWKVGMVWGAKVINPGSWTPSATKNYLFTRNALLLVKVHAGQRWALMRCALVIGNTLRLLLYPPSRNNTFYCEHFVRTRMWAVWDYFTGQWGRPRISL